MTTRKDGLQPVSRILENALREAGVGDRLQGRGPLLHWREIVGDEIAANVRAVDLADGVLTLEAGHGAWRQELTMLAPEIIEKFNARFGEGTVSQLQWQQGARAPWSARGRKRDPGR
jgi:predicted nucleic acid-binding Zn ribbon protein